MKNQNVIYLSQFRRSEAFDYAAYNRRAETRLRNSEIRAWIQQIVDTTVTAAIGVCTVFCVFLAFTML